MSGGELAQEDGRGHTVKSSDLLVRTVSAAVLLAVTVLAAYLGGLAAAIVAAAFAVIVLFEWSTMTGSAVGRTLPFAAAVAVGVVGAGLGMVTFAVAVVSIAAIVAAAYARSLWLPGGVVYASAFGMSLVVIRASPEFGLAAVIFVFAVVWATDSGAFFAGRTLGGPKLVPRLSPKKTWSGAAGGLVAALAAGGLAAQLAGIPITFGLILLAGVLSVFCQIGDFFESWVKRRFGAKDSGHIIPGHGGVMDRVDGLIFAAVAALIIGVGHAGPESLGRGLLIW